MTLLKLEHVSKVYQTGEVSLKALDDVNLEVKRGEFMAIMGPSGSGKSTLMYIMGCLDTPSSGQVYLEGKNVAGLSENELAKIRNQKIGFVFQTFNLLPKTSALANVTLPLIYADTPLRERRKRGVAILEKLGLLARKDHFPSQLSGGEQQRTAIARALIMRPSLILADEPTGNLDSSTGREVLEIFKKLHQEGHTIVFVTHDREVTRNCQRIIKIKDGKID